MTSHGGLAADVAPLGLSEVLVGPLPTTLLTDEAPDHYRVEAVFTRRPVRDEIAGILDGETRAFLTQHGYSTVELTVSDRRLEISNTNLEELRDGLGSLLAHRLELISLAVQERVAEERARSDEASQREQRRAAEVVALAGSVSFVAGDVPEVTRRSPSETALARWGTEGGSILP